MLNTIHDAIEDIKKGKILIVVDDENRENEGDFLMAGSLANPEAINFMSHQGKGLICTPISKKIADNLHLAPMVPRNTSSHETAFTVSIDAANNISTGISANDRAYTIQLISKEETKPQHFVRPGHIFPLIAKDGGVLEREGHTEAAVDLAILAGLPPVGVICEIINEDGSMARLPELLKLAKKFDMKIISIEDLIAYRLQTEKLLAIKWQKDNRFLFVDKHNGDEIFVRSTVYAGKANRLCFHRFTPSHVLNENLEKAETIEVYYHHKGSLLPYLESKHIPHEEAKNQARLRELLSHFAAKKIVDCNLPKSWINHLQLHGFEVYSTNNNKNNEEQK